MAESTADVLGLDWSTDMAEARAVLGPDRVLQGNVDPAVLFASEVSPAPLPPSCPLCMPLWLTFTVDHPASVKVAKSASALQHLLNLMSWLCCGKDKAL